MFLNFCLISASYFSKTCLVYKNVYIEKSFLFQILSLSKHLCDVMKLQCEIVPVSYIDFSVLFRVLNCNEQFATGHQHLP